MLTHEIKVRDFANPISNKFVVRYYQNNILLNNPNIPQDYTETVSNPLDFTINVPINLDSINLSNVLVRIYSDNVLSGVFTDKIVTLNKTCNQTTTTLNNCSVPLSITSITSITNTGLNVAHTGSAKIINWSIKSLSNEPLRSGQDTTDNGTINATYNSLPQGDYILTLTAADCVSVVQQLFTITSGTGTNLVLGDYEFGGTIIV